ncbi:hypothetical protein [Glycomyces sp. NRRL B-16210]|uniref:hypothetical protein n=1 Tax=Glycomyces sp. NRRL B-16210 TaxID=1463821 RepID=UPI0004BE9E2F|nr:hypothetical protein [Glycomyces sp. NRRL B-16210]
MPLGNASLNTSNDPAQLPERGLEVLKRYASRGETLTYGDLNRELGEPFAPGTFHGGIGRLCEALNQLHETTTGQPFMICALVVRADSGQPGDGFFKLADRLRRLPLIADAETRRVFVRWQCEAAFAAYSQA